MLGNPIMRCIYLLSDDLDPEIQKFRIYHDPLGKLLGPHVTVVFPFALDVADENLVAHIMENAGSLTPIKAQLGQIIEGEDGYVYFELTDGASQVATMHDNLYSGPLESALVDREYKPHITIGRAPPGKTFGIMESAKQLATRSNFTFTQLVLEHISNQGESSPIACFDLQTGIA